MAEGSGRWRPNIPEGRLQRRGKPLCRHSSVSIDARMCAWRETMAYKAASFRTTEDGNWTGRGAVSTAYGGSTSKIRSF
jgi:hypothetical protein